MSDIGVGDWVECVDAVAGEPIKPGSLYQVTAAGTPRPGATCRLGDTGAHKCPGFGLRLAGVPQVTPGAFWCAGVFRPISRPKSEIIEHLKAPVPELEPA